jgi:hypothetical protein
MDLKTKINPLSIFHFFSIINFIFTNNSIIKNGVNPRSIVPLIFYFECIYFYYCAYIAYIYNLQINEVFYSFSRLFKEMKEDLGFGIRYKEGVKPFSFFLSERFIELILKGMEIKYHPSVSLPSSLTFPLLLRQFMVFKFIHEKEAKT